MRAIDTNILARYVAGDDPVQTQLATDLLKEACFVPDTVLVETAWLLSTRYGVKRGLLAETLRDILALPHLSVTDEAGTNWAIDRFAAGADFADMMHLIGSRSADSFISFEKKLAKEAGPDTPVPVETLS